MCADDIGMDQIDALYLRVYGQHATDERNHIALDPNWDNIYMYDDAIDIDFLWA